LNTATLTTPLTPVPTSPARTLSSALTRACHAARIAAENKGQDVLVLDMRPCTPMFDFFVISTGASRRQIHTITEEVDAGMRAEGDTRMGIEGYDASKWVVQDYGDVMVHVFDPDTRDYYKLEELWADAVKVDWEREGD
jgi:ribosome-associated protein